MDLLKKKNNLKTTFKFIFIFVINFKLSPDIYYVMNV